MNDSKNKIQKLPGLVEITDESKIPTLYRYIDNQYVEQFFNNGILRIPTLYNCRKHEDPTRKDGKEGIAEFDGIPDQDGLIHLSRRHSLQLPKEGMSSQSLRTNLKANIPDGFVFSMSSEKSQKLLEHFKVDSLFAINDIGKFSKVVAPKIAQQFLETKILIGPIIYSDDKMLIQGEGMDIFVNTILSKPLKFKDEHEWRAAFTPKFNFGHPDYVFVKCPEAIQYCSKVDVTQLQ